MATIIVYSALAYGAIGVLFALPFVWRGAGRIDPAAARGTVGFRLLILPGAIAFWPVLLRRWIRVPRDPR